MKLITKKKQREVCARLIALMKMSDYMNEKVNMENKKYTEWAETMEYFADNILDIADIVGGIEMMKAIAGSRD